MSNSKGLDMRSAEHLQIANYGIGGHYEPHFDHAREGEDNFEDLGMGNRIATLLMYTSEVTAGGEYFVTLVVRGLHRKLWSGFLQVKRRSLSLPGLPGSIL